jgi:hypothetical protein
VSAPPLNVSRVENPNIFSITPNGTHTNGSQGGLYKLQKDRSLPHRHFIHSEKRPGRAVNTPTATLSTTQDYARQRPVLVRQMPTCAVVCLVGSWSSLDARVRARIVSSCHLVTRSTPMKLPSIITTILLSASILFVTASAKAEPPAFPGQPHINSALRHLNSAKEKAPTDAPGALSELDAAHHDLAHAIKNKGTYQTIARQLTEEATRNLKAGDVEKAVHKIDEAIENATHAGETGGH